MHPTGSYKGGRTLSFFLFSFFPPYSICLRSSRYKNNASTINYLLFSTLRPKHFTYILICKCVIFLFFYKTFTSDWINEDPFLASLSHQKVYWLNDGEVLVNMLWVVGGPVTLEAHQQQVGSELAHPDILKHQNEQGPVQHFHPPWLLHHSLHPIFWTLRNKKIQMDTLLQIHWYNFTILYTTVPTNPNEQSIQTGTLLQITSLGGKRHIWQQKPAAGYLQNSNKVLLITCTHVACYSQSSQ